MCIRDRDTAMQNHEVIETFYADYLDGRDSMVTVFEVYRDCLLYTSVSAHAGETMNAEEENTDTLKKI